MVRGLSYNLNVIALVLFCYGCEEKVETSDQRGDFAFPESVSVAVGEDDDQAVATSEDAEDLADSDGDTKDADVEFILEVDAGEDIDASEGSLVVLSGSAKEASTADDLAYRWSQTAGPAVVLSGDETKTAEFTIPELLSDVTLAFELKVDDETQSATDSVSVSVSADNDQPQPEAPAVFAATGGEAIALSISASDPENETLTYAWTQTAGTSVALSNADTATPGLTAPALNEVLRYEVVISDAANTLDPIEVVVNVSTPSTPTTFAHDVRDTQFQLHWSPSTAFSAIDRYEIFQDDVLIGQTSALTYTPTGLLAETSYVFNVVAVDTNDFRSGESTDLNMQTTPTRFVSHIREDCTGFTPCYTSVSAWEAAFGGFDFAGATCADGDLVCADIVLVGEISGAWTGPDTALVDIAGWTTDADHRLLLQTVGAARHNGTHPAATTYHVMDPNSAGHAIQISSNHVTLDGLIVTGLLGGSSEGFRVIGTGAVIRNVIVHDLTSDADQDGIFVSSSGVTLTVENSVFYNINRTAVHLQSNNMSNTTVYVRNVVAYNVNLTGASSYCSLGFDNNAARNYTNTFMHISNSYAEAAAARSAFQLGVNGGTEGSFGTSTNNFSSDGTAPGTNSLTSVTATANTDPGVGDFIIFADLGAGTEDFHIVSDPDNDAIDAGADEFANLKVDIDGDLRTGTFDVGADELP